MYLRFIRLVVREGSEPAFQKFYRERVIPTLASCPGCIFAGLLTPWRSEEHRSLTLWRSADDARAYEEGGLFQMLLRECMPYLSERTVWRARLAEPGANLDRLPTLDPDSPVGSMDALETLAPFSSLETLAPGASRTVSIPAEQEIPPEGYEVEGNDVGEKLARSSRSLFVRVVAIHVRPAMRQEFDRLYKERVLPAVQAATGCLGAFLAEGSKDHNEALSITVWEREENAVRYEMSAEYDNLVAELTPTLLPLSQWQLSLGETSGERRRSAGVATYHLVHGRKLAGREEGG